MNAHELAQAWIDFWNGATETAPDLLTDDFRIHFGGARPVDLAGDPVHGPQDMATYIETFRTDAPGATFSLRRPIIADTTGFAMRWDATRSDRAISGIDVLHTRNGRLAEVWTLSGARTFPA
ncbi:nuclear transport factor 2 family protein [Winogradskya humida]|uniref:SnoaL-like domain-containing protein n=1 Tax=Winogradskya humida TaxID=113566 RepID=A0ABQ3ZJ32_9ACTN|nr:nuclear transport factor 2 family protein [Actinoplanes humidus]GIE18589.1 hypothetical protein Ahu01nite_016910 [Actinoplanes humidus]